MQSWLDAQNSPELKALELNAVIVDTGPCLGTQDITFSPLNTHILLPIEILGHISVPDKKQLVFTQFLSKMYVEKEIP